MTVSLIFAGVFLIMCSNSSQDNKNDFEVKSIIINQHQVKKMSTAYFASGCFWCVEAIFERVKGVEKAVSGYAGGEEENPNYQQIGLGKTGHSETVKVYYNPNVVSYQTLVTVYYGSHNPTTINGQYPDYGTQYRSIIFYQNDTEKKIAENYKYELENSGKYDKTIVTEIIPFKKFWKAEAYHQNYEKLNPNNPYIQNVSMPRLKKFCTKYQKILKN